MEVEVASQEFITEESPNPSILTAVIQYDAVSTTQYNFQRDTTSKSFNYDTDRPLLLSELFKDDEQSPPDDLGTSVEIIYSRVQSRVFANISEPIQPGRPLNLQRLERPILTKVEEYRKFMETSLTLKIFLLETVHNLKSSITILDKSIAVDRIDSLKGINITKTWLWLIEEALILSARDNSQNAQDNKKRWLIEITSSLDNLFSTYKKAAEVCENLAVVYKRLQSSLKTLDHEVKRKFCKNIDGAQDIWEKKVKPSLKNDLEKERIEKITTNSEPSDQRRTLKVRWTSIDGITCRIAGRTEWLKFNSVNWLRDKQILTQNFITGMTDPWIASKRYILETESLLQSTKHTSVESLGRKLFMIKFNKKNTFVPKEEIQMLSSMQTNIHIFESLKPLLEHLKKRSVKNLKMLSEFHCRQDKILTGKGKRVPLERWNQIDLEVEVDFGLEEIFCRNQRNSGMNIRDLIAQQYRKELILVPVETYDYQDSIIKAKESFGDLGTPNADDDDLYERHSQVQLETNRDSVVDTCFLFTDARQEYSSALENLLKTRRLDESHMELCSDKIKQLRHILDSKKAPFIQVNNRLQNALEYLNYSNPICDYKISNTSWFQVIFRELDVWKTSDLSPRFIKHFDTMNKDFVQKGEEVMRAMKILMEVLVTLQKEVMFVDEMLKVIPGYDLMRKLLVVKSGHVKQASEHFLDEHLSFERISLKFSNSDMEVAMSSGKKSTKTTVLSLNNSVEQVQVGFICNPFLHLIRVMNKALVNITWSQKTLEENISLKSVYDLIIPNSHVRLPHYQLLEDAVTLVLFDTLRHTVSDLGSNLVELQRVMENFSRMIHLVQLQAAEKKLILIRDKINKSERHELKLLRETIVKMPIDFPVNDIVSKGEYKRLIQHNNNVKNFEGLKKGNTEVLQPERTEKASQESQKENKSPIFSEVFVPGFHMKLSHQTIYLNVITKWINDFELYVTVRVSHAYTVLIRPKVSRRIDGKRLSESLGYVPGLLFILRESIDTLNLLNTPGKGGDASATSIKTNLNHLNDILLEMEKVTKGLSSELKKMTLSLINYKKHLPQDMSYLDAQLDYLGKAPDLYKITLAIWKNWDETYQSSGDEKHAEMEIRWKSSKKHTIMARSSSQLDTWVDYSQMELFSQAKTISVITQSASNAFASAYFYLEKSKGNISYAKDILKKAWTRLHADEKMDLIPTSSVYIILRNLEYFVSTSVVSLGGVIQIIDSAKSIVKMGKRQLKKSYGPKPARPYPDSTMINLVLKAPEDIDQWLRVDLNKNRKSQDASGDHTKSIIEIKAPVEVKSSTTLFDTFTQEDKRSRTLSAKILKKRSITEASILSNKKSFDKEDILFSLQKMTAAVTSIIQRNHCFLRSPDTSLVPDLKTDHFFGILTLLVTSILELQYFREASDAQRNELMSKCKILENRLKKMNNSSVGGDISQNLTKLQNSSASFEDILQKFYPELVGSSIKEQLIGVETTDKGDKGEKNPLTMNIIDEEIQTAPEEVLAEHVAVKTLGYVWNAVCGTDTGMILKNHKSHESHSYMRLSLSKRVEIIASIMKYIDQIVIITETNLQIVKKDISSAKTMLKSQVKRVSSLVKKGIINEFNVKKLVNTIRLLKGACDASKSSLERILDLLDYGGDVIKDIYSYLNLKFRLENNFSTVGSGRFLQEYKSAMENRIIELEITFGELKQYPVTVDVPLSLSPVDLE